MRRALGLGRATQLGWKPASAKPTPHSAAAPFRRRPGQRAVQMAAPKESAAAAAPSGGGGSGSGKSEAEHVAGQARYFAQVLPLLQRSITPEVDARLQAVADAVPGLSGSSRVLDACCGDGALIPHLQARGVRDVLAVDVTPEMIAELEARFGAASTLGNEPSVHSWLGDILDLPAYQAPFDAIFFNASFGNLLDQHAALAKACSLLRPGGYLVVSHPLGRAWHEEYRAGHADIVPHALPSEAEWGTLVHDMPLRLLRYTDEPQLYIALLQVPEGYAHPAAPIRLEGEVITGFGRGSRQLGVPTANLPPEPLAEALQGLPAGVYFGWARLEGGPGMTAEDSAVHKMVMNIGRRPTFGDADPALSVEVHAMHRYSADFYGKHMRVVALAYIRPEMKFSGLDELLGRINTDIGIARTQLDLPQWQGFREDLFLQR